MANLVTSISTGWLIVIGICFSIACAFHYLVLRPRSKLRQLGEMLGPSCESSVGISVDIPTVSGQLLGRAFRIRAISGKKYSNSETIVWLALKGVGAVPSSVGPVLGPESHRSIEELWNGFELNSPKLQNLFAKGRLTNKNRELVWSCYGNAKNPEALRAILHFLARIAAEQEKNTATWVQTRNDARFLDFGDLILYIVLALIFIAAVAGIVYSVQTGRV